MKNIKRFLLISIVSLLFVSQANACGLGITHNYYMMFVAPVNTVSSKTERINRFWAEYTNGKYDDYSAYRTEIMDFAKNRKDNEMVEYLNCLNIYLYYSTEFIDTWNYPTKEDLNNSKIVVPKMINKALNYNGERLKAQYALLYVRFSTLEDNYNDIISFWNKKAKNLPNSVYKEMIENYYAGALYNTGENDKALEIFAHNEDYLSIKWMFRQHRSLTGIKQVYKNNPKSEALYYLVQDYVNRVQDSFDEFCECVDYEMVEKSEVAEFLDFANRVIREKKADLCLWNSACAMIEHIFGNNNKAKEYINKAMSCNSKATVKDNAHCIKFLIYSCDKDLDFVYINNEMQWLDSKIKQNSPDRKHYLNAKDRIIIKCLVPYYNRLNNKNMVLSLLMVNDKEQFLDNMEFYGNKDYFVSAYGEYYDELQNVSAERIIDFRKFADTRNSNPFEEYIRKQVKIDKFYFDDLIGTKYISQGEFAKAVSYLKNVPMDYINTQAVAYYMQRRDYKLERWFVNQALEEDWEEMAEPQTMRINQKITFCNEMLDLLKQYSTETNTEKKNETAYSLATRYYQASYAGQCWYLTDYYYSAYTEKAKDWQKDFVKEAEKYLNVAKKSDNHSLKTKSMYALAYIPKDEWAIFDFDYSKDEFVFRQANKKSLKYKYLNELYAYVKQNPKAQTDYIRKCDVLKVFEKHR